MTHSVSAPERAISSVVTTCLTPRTAGRPDDPLRTVPQARPAPAAAPPVAPSLRRDAPPTLGAMRPTSSSGVAVAGHCRRVASAPKEPPRMGVWRIALTGGPCGGKSTSLKHLCQELQRRGYLTFALDEVPTSLHDSEGLVLTPTDSKELMEVETHILETQCEREDALVAEAEATGRPAVVFFDRGAPDILAFVPEQMRHSFLRRNTVTLDDLVGRYDAVLHYRTAAAPMPGEDDSAYTLENNPARYHTKEQAVAVDRQIEAIWSDHPHQLFVENRTEFEKKLGDAKKKVVDVIGTLARERTAQKRAS